MSNTMLIKNRICNFCGSDFDAEKKTIDELSRLIVSALQLDPLFSGFTPAQIIKLYSIIYYTILVYIEDISVFDELSIAEQDKN